MVPAAGPHGEDAPLLLVHRVRLGRRVVGERALEVGHADALLAGARAPQELDAGLRERVPIRDRGVEVGRLALVAAQAGGERRQDYDEAASA